MNNERPYGALGCIPSQPDINVKFFHTDKELAKLPKTVDLEDKLPAVWNQGQIGSCGGHGIGGAVALNYAVAKIADAAEGKFHYTPSRLFIYYNARRLMNTTESDSGISIADGVKGIQKWGICPEDSGHDWSWEYSSTDDRFKQKPPDKCYEDALIHTALEVEQVPLDRAHIFACLAANRGVIIGVTLYESFESEKVAKTGMVPLPKKNESMIGGHCMLIVGYDQKKDLAKVRNSWGADWGQKGYCWFPMKYLINPSLGSDYWAIKNVGRNKPKG